MRQIWCIHAGRDGSFAVGCVLFALRCVLFVRTILSLLYVTLFFVSLFDCCTTGHAGSEAQQNFDPYETLDLGSGASKPEIKRAYFKKSKLYAAHLFSQFDRCIRKAPARYRHALLPTRHIEARYHPDKNPGDKLAEARFMKVAKAYEVHSPPPLDALSTSLQIMPTDLDPHGTQALTDPVAMENYRLYGHPDGRQPYVNA